MDSKFNKTIIILLFVFGIIFMIIGSTFAYFAATINSIGDNISGSTYKFNVDLNISSIKNNKLIPIADNLIDDTLNSTHICTDTRGYGLCYLYKITFTNRGSAQNLIGYLKTNNTTFETNNLKYQLFRKNGNTYSFISDMKSVPVLNANSDFTLSNNNMIVTLNDGTASNYSTELYLAIWLSDSGNNQLEDSDKTYSGSITFTSSSGNTISVDFSN